ncbi:MAG: methyltransferase [Bacteroidetes bacterium]|nr:methyltransferase [Bacteroidota bacterium]
MSKPFRFKQFLIAQDKTAMKVGTDGVLLGAWVSLNHADKILDVGTGTGLIALMLAQRSDANQIDALELDNAAYEQAVENFENSAWADRLFCYHASFQEFTAEIDEAYDLIVSNPPFYTEAFVSLDEKRTRSRFEQSLPFKELIELSTQLLTEEGQFAVIIPYKEEGVFLELTKKNKLFLNRLTRVKGAESTEIKRSLMQFSKIDIPAEIDELIIETSRHQYTDAYKQLVSDFYLKL